MRKHAAVTQIGDTIFLHGGIDPELASMKIEEMNSKVREEIEEFDKTKDDLVKRKLILPFFTIQEVAIAVQAQLFADGQAAPSMRNITPNWRNFAVLTVGSACATTVPYGFAATTTGVMQKAARESRKYCPHIARSIS